jgi:CIC family chloride channel protein
LPLQLSLSRLRRHSRSLALVILVLIGALSGLAAVLFHALLEGARAVLIGRVLLVPPGSPRVLLMLLVPGAMGALLTVLVPRWAPGSGGGLTLVRTAYEKDPTRIDLRTWIGTFLANPLSLGAGTPLGPEGPTVVLTSGLAVAVGRLTGLPARMIRGLVPVGTAAGIAAIFNTPITGVVFALEEVIGTASRGVLGGAIVAAVAAAVVQKQLLGGRHLLPASPASWSSAWELFGFAVLGIVVGAAAGLLPRLVSIFSSRIRTVLPRGSRNLDALRGLLAGIAVGALGLLSPDILGTGYRSIADWLAGNGEAGTAAISFGAKFLGVAVALAAPLIGGVFAPSLFLGASLGACAGQLLHHLYPAAHIDPGAYALVGMGAFFAGYLRTPIASILIVFELTGNYDLVVPLMLAVALSSLVARRISHTTLVERGLQEAGVAPSESRLDPTTRVRDLMTAPAASLREDATLEEALALAAATPHSAYPVVDGEGICTGMIGRTRLEEASRQETPPTHVGVLMRDARVVALADETLEEVSVRLARAGETRCPVIESPSRPLLLGILCASDLLKARIRAASSDGAWG